jgi:hypothetical protein
MADDNPFADLIPAAKSKPPDQDNPFADLIPAAPATDAPVRITVRPQDAAPPPETSASDAFGRGFTSAASFGFRDELAGLGAAGGADPNSTNPADLPGLIYGIGKGAYRKLTGDPEAERLYAEEVARQREQGKAISEEYPIASGAGTVAGAVALPFGVAARGVGLGARTLAAARTGAIQGGLTGLGEAEGNLGERLPSAVEGAGLGATIGGVATPAISAVGATVRHLVSPITDMVNAYRGFKNPAEDAVRRVGQVIQRGVEAGDTGLTDAEFAAARAAGQPVTTLDRMGESGRALARAAANVSPEARAGLNRTIDDRFEGQGGRFATWLDTQFNHPNVPVQKLAQREEARLVNVPAYERAYEAGDRPIWSDKLEQLTSSPDVANAVRGAMSRWRSFQVLDGYGGLNPPFNVTPDGRLVFTNSAGAPVFPNIQLWDYAGRTLGSMAERARASGDRTNATLYGGLERQLKTELDKLVPEFGQARAGARTFFGDQNAVTAGENFFGQGERRGLKQARLDYDQMTPQQQRLFQDGYVSRMVDVAHSVRDRRSLLQRFDTSDAARDEMRMVLGPRRAAETEAFLRVEEVMDRARGAVQGQSTTVRQALEALAFGGGVGYATGDVNPLTNPAALIAGAAAYKRKQFTQSAEQRVMGEVARLLTSGNPADYNKAIQVTARRPYIMDALRKATANVVGRVGGTIAGEQQGP